jgi:opacity protein-like surface antigen
MRSVRATTNFGGVLLAVLAIFQQPCPPAFAQDAHAQVPAVLHKVYLQVGVGALTCDYGASQFRAAPGYAFESADSKPAAARLVLGYEFNRYLAAQASLMRPFSWTRYEYRGPDGRLHSASVWLSYLALTLRPQLALTDRLLLYGEAGASLVARHGFAAADGAPLVDDASYAAALAGGGVEYRIDDRWAVTAGAVYFPENASAAQPAASLVSAGLSCKLAPDGAGKGTRPAGSDHVHPDQWVQVGYSSNAAGYGVNDALADAYLFWPGDVGVRQGLTLQYQRNVYRSAGVFAFDWGVSASRWRSDGKGQDFFTLAIFPVFRFNLLHAKALDAYFAYSVAGPAYISRTVIDGVDTGKRFTFQDTVGVGMFFGERRRWNAEMRVGHYSNGNIFPENPGVTVPPSLNLGYAF